MTDSGPVVQGSSPCSSTENGIGFSGAVFVFYKQSERDEPSDTARFKIGSKKYAK